MTSLPKKVVNVWHHTGKDPETQLWVNEPHINQRKLWDSKKRWKVVVCGRRFGKTVFAVKKLIYHALLNSKSNFWYVAPTYKAAKMIAWQMLVDSLEVLPKELVIKKNESELYVILGNGSRIDIKGADSPDSLRGVGLNGVVLDEYADMRPNVFSEIIRPALTDRRGWCIFIGTPKGFNHFYDRYMEAKENDKWDAFHFTSYDNPMLNKSEIEEAKIQISLDKFAQEYMADFRKNEGLVYKEFNRDKHIKELPDRQIIETIAGIDFGYNNPSSIVVIKRDFDNVYWVVDEWYHARKTTPELINAAKNMESKYGIQVYYPDVQAAAAIEECKRAGLSIRDSNKDVIKGIDSVRALLKNNRLFVSPKCKSLIAEFETYAYPDKEDLRSKQDKNEPEVPIKENDHALDALRYAVFTHEPIKAQSQEDFNLYAATYA